MLIYTIYCFVWISFIVFIIILRITLNYKRKIIIFS